MKNWKLILGLLILAIMMLGCTKINPLGCNAAPKNKKLIVYYSLTGNTKFVAEQIQSLTGADVFELKLVDPYPVEFDAMIERARNEHESGYRPALINSIKNLSAYDVIFIGSPNWFGTQSIPILAWLESHDLSGKTIIPFVTFGRGGLQNTVTDLKTLLPNNTILEEFGVFRDDVKDSQTAISQWLDKIGMLK